MLTESCLNGYSEMAGQMATAVTTFFFNRIMMRLLGEDGVAAVTIMIYSQFMLSSLYIGFSMGVAPVFSYNCECGDGERMRKVFRLCAFFIAAVSAAVFVLSEIFGSFLAGIFSAELCVYSVFPVYPSVALWGDRGAAYACVLGGYGDGCIGVVSCERILANSQRLERA